MTDKGVIKRMRVLTGSIHSAQTLVALLVVALVSLAFIFTSAVWAGSSDKHKILIGKNQKMTTTDPTVVMETTKGTIKIQVLKTDAPITSDNFLDLVQRGFYNGLTFHRYEPGFVIQGGDPKGNGTGGSGKNIKLEIAPRLKHDTAGVIAMARSANPDSASSQFYFTLAAAPHL